MNKKQKIFLILLGLFLAFVFGELTLRVIGFSGGIYQLDKETGLITLKRNWQGYWIKNCYRNLVKTNSLGFHDYEFEQNKPNDVFRIIILGDSYVEALQVSRENSFHNLLEIKLNKELDSNKKFEVYAFGHSGNGTLLNYLYLKNYGLKYKPDLVINAFCVGNDFRDDSYELTQIYSRQTGDTAVYRRPFVKLNKEGNVDFVAVESELLKMAQEPKSFIRGIAKKSVLATQLYHKYKLIKSLIKSKVYGQKERLEDSLISESPWDKIPVDYQVFLKDYPNIWNEAWEVEEKLLRAMKEIVEKNNSKFMVVSLTEAFRVHNDLDLNQVYAPYVFEIDKPERLLQEISQRQQFSYLALVPIFRERFGKEHTLTTFSCDKHWNETGHRWAAEALFEYLKTNPQLLDVE